MPSLFLLGPQRPNVNLGVPFADLGGDGAVALVSAGWQEAEGDIEHVQEATGRSLVELKLYARAEKVFEREPQLQKMYRERQDKLIELQRLYRIRLRESMTAARKLLREDGDAGILEHEQRHAISQQRTLDRHHLQRITEINSAFEMRIAAWPGLIGQREEVAGLIADCDTVLLTGGNVAVLLNRLQLFGLGPVLRGKNVVAWSAGAMVLADKIVLFHDNMPQGNRDAEIFNQGLGLVDDLIFLPDAKHRLKFGDAIRVALFSRRFSPAGCLTLDNGALLRVDDGDIRAADGVRRLTRSGRLRKVRIR